MQSSQMLSRDCQSRMLGELLASIVTRMFSELSAVMWCCQLYLLVLEEQLFVSNSGC